MINFPLSDLHGGRMEIYMIYEKQKTKNISFPLGGIGTGCIGLSGNGELNDWEIYNRPNKNTRNGYSHFAIKATRNGKNIAKVLHGDTNESYLGNACKSNGHYGMGFGPKANSLAGFPHFKNHVFEGNFPIAKITFSDEDFPATVKLCAFNPFIPHDDFNSSLPAGFFSWEIENTSDDTVDFALACSVHNPAEDTFNKGVFEDGLKGVFLGCGDKKDNEKGYTDLCILTDNSDTCVQEYWFRGGWQDSCTTYWKNFLNLERMPERTYSEVGGGDHGCVVSYVTVAPHEKAVLRFVISWNVPIAYNYWTPADEEPTWRNYYAAQFKDSVATAKYSIENFDSFYKKTELFSDALQSCTLSDSVKDAISANLSVLKSPTTLRLEDGSFWGWEGCCETVGSCFGTCQHVWNYAYVMPYLFPKLERTIRENTVKYSLQDCGTLRFRMDLPLQQDDSFTRACVDGQMGEVIKFYREWKLSGDNEWLKKHSESIFKILEYAWSDKNPDKWDANMDGVIEGMQHHTLDMELFGPNSWLEGFYLLALDCGAKMAEFLGDKDRVELYTKLYRSGKAWMNENLFNGKYFFHKVNLSDKEMLDSFNVAQYYWNSEANEIKYQVADGCIIDQMLADWHAVLLGSDPVFDSDKKKIALENLYKNNYKDSMRSVTNMWRNFSVNDERGTVICSYPDGVKVPAIPIAYCEETMTGFEYALAGLMISEGYIEQGENLVSAVRDRYDGEKRNPWNELECGNNYARSMASYALMPIYSGFTFDMTEKFIGFNPKTESGRYLFSVGDSWGTVEFDNKEYQIEILGNPLVLDLISLPNSDNLAKVFVDGKEIDFSIENSKIKLNDIKIEKTISFDFM